MAKAKASKAEDVYSYIKKQILSGKWKEGDRLNDSELAEEIGVSTLSVREALFRLMESGIISKEHWKGYFVKEITGKTVSDLVQIRIALESYAMRNFVQECTSEQIDMLQEILEKSTRYLDNNDFLNYLAVDYSFHETIYRHQHNSYIIRALDNLQLSIHFVRKKSMGPMETFAEIARSSIQWHQKMFNAIKAKNADDAVSLLVQHLSEHQSEAQRFLT
ncbi:GntR family transcriptional regulator [Oscillibacter sp.]|uniref:GntR family transcriptional regulator n=1 Tax=Oscillibacter sp. TaxID=1945593 RepID=UPI00262A9D61|nr:GntR family transcriptional regulator [Oscillibacter sp.]MDD3347716.1 GntR family transcriptional regulator [Oscillibacter sp.]